MPVVHLGSTYVGSSTSTAHQIWAGKNAARFGFEIGLRRWDSGEVYQDDKNAYLWTWSGFELDGTPNSVKFTPDPVNGGLQGDFSYGTGSNTSAYPTAVSTYNKTKQIMEVDPAGGTLEFSMIAREFSYWHKIGPVLRVTNTSQLGNQMNIKEFRTYFLDNKSQYDIQKVPYKTNVQSLYYTQSSNSYSYEYVFDVLKSDISTTYQPSKSNKKDLTFTCYVGPNNTPYSAYTYIGLLGFANEVNDIEYNNTSAVHPYVKGEVSGVEMTLSRPPLGRPVSTNVFLTAADGNIYHNIYKDWRTGDLDGIPDQRLICFWQKPNVLYYVHMLWVNPLYTDYDNPPTNSLMSTWTTTWNVEVQDMLLYVEFGISPDGGKHIFWNNSKGTGNIGEAIQKVYDRNISATVPTDIHKHITPSIELTSVNRQNKTPYTLSSVSTCSCKSTTPFKFVKIRVSLSSKNDETHNLSENRYQMYSIINYQQRQESIYHEGTASGIHTYTTTYEDPTNNGISYANYGKSNMNLTTFSCQVGRKYKTNDWNLQVKASLYYESGSMRYEGDTDIHTN